MEERKKFEKNRCEMERNENKETGQMKWTPDPAGRLLGPALVLTSQAAFLRAGAWEEANALGQESWWSRKSGKHWTGLFHCTMPLAFDIHVCAVNSARVLIMWWLLNPELKAWDSCFKENLGKGVSRSDMPASRQDGSRSTGPSLATEQKGLRVCTPKHPLGGYHGA